MDASLVDALDVPIPDDLVARLKLRTVIDSEQARRSYRIRFAMAASVVLAVAVGLLGYRTWSVDQDYQRLTEAVVRHIEHEHQVLELTTADAPNQLANMFVNYGAEKASAIGAVKFTKLCPVMGKQAIHAVLTTPSGPVTLIFVPGMDVPDVHDTRQDGLNNHVVPMGGGALILTGESTTSFDEITNQVQHAVEWEI
jgi:hypothetical protein